MVQRLTPLQATSDADSLYATSSVLGHPATARFGLFGLPVRVVRKIFKAFLRPWLDVQTRFNHAVIRAIEQTQARTGTRIDQVVHRLEMDSRNAGGEIGKLWAECLALKDGLRDLAELTREERVSQFRASRIQNSRCEERFEAVEARTRELLEAEAEEVRQLLDRVSAEAGTEREARFRAELEETHRALREEFQRSEQRLREQSRDELEAGRRAIREEFQQSEQRWHDHVARLEEEWRERTRVAEQTAVNRELSHEGQIAESGLFFNPPVHVNLVNGKGRVLGVSERILEHIYVHSRLPKPPGRLLDIGSAESTNAIEMASLGFDVVGVDLRLLPLTHPNFRMVQANLADLPFGDESFDVAVSLSTVEHVGLGWYSEEGDGVTDQKAIDEVYRVLKPGAPFILTVPYGQAASTPVHRIYDRPSLRKLLHRFAVEEMSFGLREGGNWVATDDAQRAESADSRDRVSAIAMVVARKPDDSATESSANDPGRTDADEV